jgi:iron complex outermembrane receptor protein
MGRWYRDTALGAVLACSAFATTSAIAAETSGDGATQLGEIVVTATKQSQNIDKVPLSITAVTQSTLDQQGFKTVQDLSRSVPGLTFRTLPGGGQTDIAIRGIFSTVGAPTTGIYLDDAPLQKRNAGAVLTGNGAPLPQIFDVERIEVLRGPQGTLYGGSSEGGTVRIITPTPSLTSSSNYERAEINTMKDGGVGYEAGVAIGGPLIKDKVGFRASLWGQRTPGWVDDVSQGGATVLAHDINWGKNAVGRLAVLLVPVDGLTITPSVLYSYSYKHGGDSFLENAPGLTVPGPPPHFPLVYAPFTQFGAYRTANNYYTAAGVETPYVNPRTSTLFVPSMSINYDLGAVELHSNTSYIRDNTHGRNGASGTDYLTFSPVPFIPGGGLNGYQDYMNYRNNRNVWSEELRLSSAPGAGRLSWIAGAFVSRAKGKVGFEGDFYPSLDQVTQYFLGIPAAFIFGVPGNTPITIMTSYKETEIAGFGDATYALTDKLKFTAGLRVSHDKFDYSLVQQGLYLGTTVATVANGGITSGVMRDTPITPKFSLSYQLTPNDMIYATAAKGYRSGGVNSPPGVAFSSPASLCYADLQALGGAPPASYGSDSLWSYEAGAKLRLFDNRVHLSGGAYYVDWSNVQSAINFRCGYSYVANVPGATSKGFDLQGDLRPIDPLTISFTAGYTDARYSKTVYTPSGSAIVLSKGDPLPIPKWTASVGVTYQASLSDSLDGYVRGDVQYAGSWFATAGPGTAFYNANTYRQRSSTFASLRVGVRASGFDISVFSDNLFDSKTPLLHSKSTTSIFATDSTFHPRTVGATVTHRF